MTSQLIEVSSIDDCCTWKKIERDSESTTFADVKKLPYERRKEHPLYGCIECTGYDYSCSGYVTLKGENNNGIRK